ncbi:MAG: gamma-glutamyltransferase [Planctomycetota bacterium]
MKRLCFCGLVGVSLWASFGLPAAAGECVVASVQPLATDAGLEAYRRGGNAIDAAVATALTLGVVDTPNSGIGGGCFILIRRANGAIAAIDGREMAPAAATRDMFLRDGKAVPQLSQTGPLASGVPGALAAYSKAINEHGALTLPELLRPAADIAEQGFALDRVYARRLASTAEVLRRFEGSAAALLKPDGSPYAEGETLKQPNLARTYRAIAEHGPEWFYDGPFSKRVGAWMAANGGVITTDDFASYRAVAREPVRSTYRGWDVVGFPPPSSGGIHVAQILNMLESFDLATEKQRDPVGATHLIVEAMKLAFADRAYWLGDADFAEVPAGLVDQVYADELAGEIERGSVAVVDGHGDPPDAATRLFNRQTAERHTTHIAAADTEGNWVAITATVNTSFGSKVVVPGTGVVLNNEMDDFSAQPGVPNAFGLLGAENNSVKAGKRPLSSMSPTIVLKGGEPVMTLGAAGGPKIITQVVLGLVRTLDYGMPLGEAVAAPRFHHQWRPDVVMIEEAAPASLGTGLSRIGHEVSSGRSAGVTQAIGLDPSGGLIGVHDPRVPGKVGRAQRD